MRLRTALTRFIPASWRLGERVARSMMAVVWVAAAQAQELHLQVLPTAAGESLRLHEALSQSVPARITRLDFLLSGLALKKEDGTWLESRDWFAYLSATTGSPT